jgi:hypothetical protein
LHSIRSQQNHLPKFSISSSYSLSLTTLASHPFPDLNFFGNFPQVCTKIENLCLFWGSFVFFLFFPTSTP